MDCFIKKIFEGRGENDELVHGQFQKFSRGIFKNRALIKSSKSAKGFSLATSSEYANELVRTLASKLGDKKAQVTGVVVSTLDLKNKLPYKDIRQFMGIKQYVIEGEMSGNEIIKLQDNAPDAFFALSLSFGDMELKIKPKAPKSAKPSTSEKGPKIDFCKLKTTDSNIIEHFVIEKGWKSLEVNHTYVIDDIILPSGISDPNEIRRLAKRKGKIVRKAIIDGREVGSEKDFVA